MLLAVIIMATFVAWIWFWVPAELAYTTRTMIAWSFDRVAPDGLGYVSQRFHTPVVAIWLSTAVAIVFMWLIAYRDQPADPDRGAGGGVGDGDAGRRLVPPHPASAVRDVAGRRDADRRVPAMVVTGLIAAAFMAWVLYLLWNDPIAAGPLLTADHVAGVL